MRKCAMLFATTLLVYATSFSQVAINTTNTPPDSTAMLDISSTSKGLLIPRLTTAQRTSITGIAKGLTVFDSTTNSFWYHNGTSWGE